jgi:predicted membrane channel-forming protein YqfA (hemolysin III family)
MDCPNSDKNFDKILSNFVDTSNNNYSQTRKYIFYNICIPIRLILYSLVYVYRNVPIVQYLIGVFALFTMINLYTSINDKNNQSQWWSKKFQLVIASLLFTCVVIKISGYDINTLFLPILLFISLLGGVFQSLMIEFC